MAGIRFIDHVTDAEEISQVRDLRAFVKRLCNNAQATICGLHEWPFLWTVDWFQTVASYTTGTVSVTNGSATVTGSGTTFTAAMVGRKFRVSGSAYYTIKTFTSTTSITLDQAYTGTTASGSTYEIYKDEYLLRADVDTQKRIRQSDNGVALFSLSATEFDEYYSNPTGLGTPSLDVFAGKATKTYTTGTVSMTSGTRTLTGSSTAWTTAEGITKGTKIKIGSLIFTVNTVDSDTAITTYEAATSTIAAGTVYTAILDNYVVQLHSPPDSVLTYYYRFQRIPAVMDADNDMPELPYPMHPLITQMMLPTLYRHKGFTQKAVEAKTDAEKELQMWMGKYGNPVMDRKAPIHPFTLRPDASYDARWPADVGFPLKW